MATATDALNAASAGIEDIPEESRNDSLQGWWMSVVVALEKSSGERRERAQERFG